MQREGKRASMSDRERKPSRKRERMSGDEAIPIHTFPPQRFLHDIGSLCYFPDVDEDMVVVDPTYLTNLFSSVISMKNQV